MFFQLTQELKDLIFEFDNTYKEKFNEVINKFKNEEIYKIYHFLDHYLIDNYYYRKLYQKIYVME